MRARVGGGGGEREGQGQKEGGRETETERQRKEEGELSASVRKTTEEITLGDPARRLREKISELTLRPWKEWGNVFAGPGFGVIRQ